MAVKSELAAQLARRGDEAAAGHMLEVRAVDPELAADAIEARDSPLTSREADVLELAADGAPVGEIARRAALTSGTVRNYLSSAAAKLGAEDRHEAVQLARANGWI
jgi:two-component system response regulator DesR